MKRAQSACVLATLALLSAGCSTKPRNFAAQVSTPAAGAASFEDDYRVCQRLVASGHSSGFRDAALQTAATGAGAVGAAATMVTGGMVGIGTTGGAAVAATAALPVVGILAGLGVSRAIRGGNERKLKRNMTACLSEYGYQVEGWQKIARKADAAAAAAQSSMDGLAVQASGQGEAIDSAAADPSSAGRGRSRSRTP